ncbi:MAG: tRNA (adenosine(37)-N6)-threonylcarbamoyltransferase complex dimerization subunit type 1 TsaB [Flavobacterium sp.]|nr:tRNA (adenosine(37)-N6)-threonylcarbamoyltransferase complex dimerization subunit type 1 TsaB [Flavobacterium sp.]
MTYILNLETATKNCSVSISQNGKTILCKEMAEAGYSHAEKLHVFIEECLQELKLTPKDLSSVAVSQGPGSYTGLRIGVSAAKGLCFALHIPLIAIDTLLVLASQLTISEGIIIPMIDARRMEVYSAIFTSKLDKIREVQAEILTENSFKEIAESIHFVGDCAEKAKTVLTDTNFIFHEEIIYPSANEMSALSYQKFQQSKFEDVAYFEPYYLKDFMATVSKK